jgi:hypothetical protein
MVQLEVLADICLGGQRKTTKNLVRIVSVLTEIQTNPFPI